MPTLEMRGRYLMREYWSDVDLFTRTTAEVRELYKGLWMLSDDEGWMPRNVAAIGAALYRFEAPEARSVLVRSGIDRLKALGKVQSFRCGCLFLPTVARYPRAGKKTTVHSLNHQKHSTAFKSHVSNGIQTDLKPSPVPTRPVPSLPDSAGARDDFKEKMAANGLRGGRR